MCSCPRDSMNPEAGRAQQLAERSAGTCLGPIQMKAGCWGMSVHHPGLGCYVPQPLPKGLFRLPDWQAWELLGSVPTRDSGSTQSDVVHRLPVPLGTPAPTTAWQQQSATSTSFLFILIIKWKKKPQQLTLSSHHLTESRGFWHCCSLNGLLSLSHWTSKLTMPGQVWDPHWECEGLLLFKTAMLQSPFLMQCVCSQKPKFYFPFLKLWCSVVMSACEWI